MKTLTLLMLATLLVTCQHVPQGWGTVDANMMQAGMVVAKMHMQDAPDNIKECSLAGALGLLQTKDDKSLSTDAWSQIGCKTALEYSKINYPKTDLIKESRAFFVFPPRMTDAEVLLTIVFTQWDVLPKS